MLLKGWSFPFQVNFPSSSGAYNYHKIADQISTVRPLSDPNWVMQRLAGDKILSLFLRFLEAWH